MKNQNDFLFVIEKRFLIIESINKSHDFVENNFCQFIFFDE